MNIRKYLCEKKEFANFAAQCGFLDEMGVCFRDATEDDKGHELHSCELKNCKHTQWLNIKKQIEQGTEKK